MDSEILQQWNNFSEMEERDKLRIEDFANYYGVIRTIEELTRINNSTPLPEYNEQLRNLLKDETKQREMLNIQLKDFIKTYNLHFTFVERIVEENNKSDKVVKLSNSQFSVKIINSITQIRDGIALLSNEMYIASGIAQIKIAADNIKTLIEQHHQNPSAARIPDCLNEFAELCCGLCELYDKTHTCREADYDNIYQQVEILLDTMKIYAES